MYCLFRFAVLLIVLTSSRTSGAKGGICGEVPDGKCDLCISTKLGLKFTNKFLKLVKEHKDVHVAEIFSLREPKSLKTIDEFSQELDSYKSILCFFQSSMKAYVKTPEYNIQKLIIKEESKIKNYLTRLPRGMEALEQIISLVSNETTQTTCNEINQKSEISPLQDSQEIFVYTHHVINKLTDLFRSLWGSQCKLKKSGKKCGGKASSKNKETTNGKGKNKCRDKGKSKTKNNRGNKNSKSQKKTKQ